MNAIITTRPGNFFVCILYLMLIWLLFPCDVRASKMFRWFIVWQTDITHGIVRFANKSFGEIGVRLESIDATVIVNDTNKRVEHYWQSFVLFATILLYILITRVGARCRQSSQFIALQMPIQFFFKSNQNQLRTLFAHELSIEVYKSYLEYNFDRKPHECNEHTVHMLRCGFWFLFRSICRMR